VPDKTLNSRKLISLRDRKGWTQKRLAEETKNVDPENTGVNVKTIQNAESRKPMSPRTQALLSTALGVRPEQLEDGYELRRAAPYVAGVALAAVAASIFALQRPNVESPTFLPVGGVPTGLTADVDYRVGPVPHITALDISGERFSYSLTLHGRGFGTFPYPLPFYGDSAFFRLGDTSHSFEAGYLDDQFAVRYLRWTDGEITVGDILMRAPGDLIGIGVWNPQTGRGAAWAGNLPPLNPGSPRIASIAFSQNGSNMLLHIVGSNFGAAPRRPTMVGNVPNLSISDLRYHPFIFHPHGASLSFGLDNYRNPQIVMIKSWKDTDVIAFIDCKRLAAGMQRRLHPGDPAFIQIRNSMNNLMTSWGGNIPPALGESSGWTIVQSSSLRVTVEHAN